MSAEVPSAHERATGEHANKEVAKLADAIRTLQAAWIETDEAFDAVRAKIAAGELTGREVQSLLRNEHNITRETLNNVGGHAINAGRQDHKGE